jgi:hypothetical protein
MSGKDLMENEEVSKNPKYTLLEILRILLFFHSLRELEKKLGVPMQTLWKYHTLRSMPEKDTAIKILKRIRESGILRNTIYDLMSKTTDPIVALNNPGVLELIAYIIGDHIKALKINAIFSFPNNYSAIIAANIASRNKLKLCLANTLFTTPKSICTEKN